MFEKKFIIGHYLATSLWLTVADGARTTYKTRVQWRWISCDAAVLQRVRCNVSSALSTDIPNAIPANVLTGRSTTPNLWPAKVFIHTISQFAARPVARLVLSFDRLLLAGSSGIYIATHQSHLIYVPNCQWLQMHTLLFKTPLFLQLIFRTQAIFDVSRHCSQSAC